MQKLNRNVFNLSIATKFPKESPEQYIPADGVCTTCDRLLRNHPGNERAIAANSLTRVVNREGKDYLQSYGGIPYCNCAKDVDAQSDRQRQWSNLPRKAKKFETFEHFPCNEEAVKASLKFSLGKGAHILMLTGGAGCGKTHLLQSIGRVCLDAGQSVRYELTAELLDRLRATYNRDAEENYNEAIDRCHKVNVLLLDDIGLEKASEWVIEKTTAMVDDRYRNGRRLAVATNKTRAQIANTMGFRLASRLWDTSPDTVRVVHLTCADYRMSTLAGL